MMTEIRKGMCHGCPWNYGDEATEMAFNLGCLPSAREATELAESHGKAWACHSDPHKLCCGYAANNKDKIGLELYVGGDHDTSSPEYLIHIQDEYLEALMDPDAKPKDFFDDQHWVD